MADIHNSIILDDRMSKPIADINAHMLELKKSMEKTNTMLESMAGKMGGVKTKSIALGSAIGNMAGNLATKLAELPGQALRMGDTLMSMRARIDNINDGMQTTDELMEKVYQSSMRSRSAYVDTAAVVAKLGLNAADAFGNFDEIVGFAETMNKAFVVSGASASEMQAGMYQLTQAMASGRLQGDEFRSISENAPKLANAIAKFTVKSRGELKQMSSDGEITADVIKKALTFAADDIEAKFKNMPITFMQSLTRMENKAIRFFSDDLTSVSHVAAKGIMFVSENMYELAIASAYVGTVAAAYFAPALYSAAGAAWTAAAGFAAANWPLLVGVGILFALAGAMLEFPELAGTVAGAFAAMGSGIYNVLVGILNFWKVVINAIISGINVIRKFNAERLGQKYVAIEMMQMTDMKDPNEAFKEGKTWGTEAAKNLGERLDKLKKGIMDPQNRNTSPTQNENKDNNVDKVKSVGKVKDPIKIDDESLKLIRDVAMKKYQVNFKTVQPVFRLSFGDIRETIDIDKAVERVEARIVDLYNSNLVVPNNG